MPKLGKIKIENNSGLILKISIWNFDKRALLKRDQFLRNKKTLRIIKFMILKNSVDCF